MFLDDALVDEGLELLTEEACWALLRDSDVGRVGVNVVALPAIFPVNYAIIDDTIIFRTAPGSKLTAASQEAVVAFQVDDYDRTNRSGWSVLAIGTAEVVHDIDTTFKVLAAHLEPWAGGKRTNIVRITPGFISGRRIARDAANGHRTPPTAALVPSPPPTE